MASHGPGRGNYKWILPALREEFIAKEGELILKALVESDGFVMYAARLLKISRAKLVYLMKIHKSLKNELVEIRFKRQKEREDFIRVRQARTIARKRLAFAPATITDEELEIKRRQIELRLKNRQEKEKLLWEKRDKKLLRAIERETRRR